VESIVGIAPSAREISRAVTRIVAANATKRSGVIAVWVAALHVACGGFRKANLLEPLQIYLSDRDDPTADCGGLTTGARKMRDRTENCLEAAHSVHAVVARHPRVGGSLHFRAPISRQKFVATF